MVCLLASRKILQLMSNTLLKSKGAHIFNGIFCPPYPVWIVSTSSAQAFCFIMINVYCLKTRKSMLFGMFILPFMRFELRHSKYYMCYGNHWHIFSNNNMFIYPLLHILMTPLVVWSLIPVQEPVQGNTHVLCLDHVI